VYQTVFVELINGFPTIFNIYNIDLYQGHEDTNKLTIEQMDFIIVCVDS
jgi:hypothetical protein